MNYFSNNEAYVKGTEFLKDQIIKKGYAWDTGRMKPMDGAMFANASIEIGGTQQLLTGSSVKERGVTNFDGSQLVKGRVFVANAIAFGFAVGNATDLVHAVNYDYKTAPAYLKHAILIVRQKDEKVINLPIIDLVNANGSGNNSFYRDLGALALIEDEAIVDIEVEFPQGVNANLPAGKKLFVSVYMKGLETHLKR